MKRWLELILLLIVPLTLGAGHAAVRLSAGGASPRLYESSLRHFEAGKVLGRTAMETHPAVALFNSGYQAVTGKDAIDYHELSTSERVWSGAFAAASVGPGFVKGVKLLKFSSKATRAAKLEKATVGVLKIGETANKPTTLQELDVVIGFVKEGKILAQFKARSDYASLMSHQQLAEKLGILTDQGKLAEGVEAFTVFKQHGQIAVRGSGNFAPTVSPKTEKLLKQLFQ